MVKRSEIPRWLVSRQQKRHVPSIADRVNAAILAEAKSKKVMGVNLPVVVNREEARARLRGKGPFQFMGAPARPDRTRTPGRTRRKREVARERTRA